MKSEMDREPFVRALKVAFICLMRPLDGVAYVEAKIFQACCDVVAQAINGMMEW